MNNEIEKYKQHTAEFTAFMIENLRGYNDIGMIILRGHILVEYTLNNFIKTVSPNGVAFKDDKFTFAQKVEIVRTLSSFTDNTCDYILLLNKLRNQIAHTLKYDKKLLDKLHDTAEQFYDDFIKWNKENRIQALKAAINLMCTSLNMGIIGIKLHQDLTGYIKFSDLIEKQKQVSTDDDK